MVASQLKFGLVRMSGAYCQWRFSHGRKNLFWIRFLGLFCKFTCW